MKEKEQTKKLEKYAFEPDFAIPPGDTLQEIINHLGMSKKDLADRTGLAVQLINRILSGEQVITYETANKLELVTDVPSKFWNNLESNYRTRWIDEAKRKATEIYCGE